RVRRSFCENRNGAWTPVRESEAPESPLADVFSGIKTRVKGALRGTLTVTDVTSVAVEGSFTLSGTAELSRLTYEYRRTETPQEICEYGASGLIIGERTTDSEDATGSLTVSGTFQAPAAAEVGRQGRLITTTRRIR
ncbi:MAG: hypothetical protein R3324_07785, partial [Halobacteriales archaeon]|nr:hypothetical protein [Halobacteriales archaeon]